MKIIKTIQQELLDYVSLLFALSVKIVYNIWKS